MILYVFELHGLEASFAYQFENVIRLVSGGATAAKGAIFWRLREEMNILVANLYHFCKLSSYKISWQRNSRISILPE